MLLCFQPSAKALGYFQKAQNRNYYIDPISVRIIPTARPVRLSEKPPKLTRARGHPAMDCHLPRTELLLCRFQSCQSVIQRAITWLRWKSPLEAPLRLEFQPL